MLDLLHFYINYVLLIRHAYKYKTKILNHTEFTARLGPGSFGAFSPLGRTSCNWKLGDAIIYCKDHWYSLIAYELNIVSNIR